MNTPFSLPPGFERGGVHRIGDVLPMAVANILSPPVAAREEPALAVRWTGPAVIVEQLSVQLVHA